MQQLEAERSKSLNAVYRIQGNSDLPDIAEILFRDTDVETNTNARLIAAAPALLEALETLLDVFLDGRMEEFVDKEELAYRQADAALALVYGTPDNAA